MHFRTKLLHIKICFWTALFVLSLCVYVKAQASEASGGYTDTNFFFTGSDCSALFASWDTKYRQTQSWNGTDSLVDCNPATLAVGSVTMDIIFDGSATTVPITIVSLDSTSSSGGTSSDPAPTAESLAIDRLTSALQSPDTFFGSLAGLTTDDALNILYAVILLWAGAWGMRQVVRSLNFNERSENE